MESREFHLSDEQQAAVDSNAKRLCILACAGSGKTTTLTRRIARFVDEGVDPSKIAAITFTVLAGDKLKYELSRIIKDKSATARMFVGTIHSFCYQLLVSERVMSAEAFEPITESQQFVLLTKYWSNWAIQNVDPDSDRTPLIERLMASFDIIKMNGIPVESLVLSNPEVARVYCLYNAFLNDNGFLDFADMLVKARDLLMNDKDARERTSKRFPYVFIDEYQDVDPIQAALIDTLSRKSHVCVVGDDDQAIYQFRGADERNIQAFSLSKDCVTAPLSENRRCPNNVLAVAENNIRRVSYRLPKSMFTRVGSGNFSCDRFDSIEGELEFLVARIRQLASSKAVTSYSQIGILLRSMASYGSMYVAALKAAGIPCLAHGAKTLFEDPAIQKVMAIIEWFAKDVDGLSEFQELLPIFSTRADVSQFPPVDGSAFLAEDDFNAAGLSKSDWLLFNHLQELRTKYEEKKFGSLLDLVHRFIEDLGIFTEGSDSSRYNVAQFTRILSEYEKIQDNKNFRSLAAFLVSYARNSFDEVSSPDVIGDAVNILTIHQSKGLEFDYVFLPMLVEGRFPVQNNAKRWLIDDILFNAERYKTSLDNERRLFYVACTRARKALHLLASRDVGLKNPKAPSIFWYEASRTEVPDENTVPIRPHKDMHRDRFLVAGYSSLEYYLTCPLRYKIIVEYGLEFPQAVFFQFGKLMHDTLAKINQAAMSGYPLTLTQAKTILEQSLPLYYKNTNMRQYDIQKQLLRAQRAIETYYSQHADWMPGIVGIEGDLAYPLEKALIRGRYDVLIQNARGKYSIIDYKTGRPHAGLKTDFQMQFYSLAAKTQLKLDIDEAIVYYLEDDKLAVFDVNPQFLLEGEQRLANTIEGILSRVFLPTSNKVICPQCEAKRLCAHNANSSKLAAGENEWKSL